MDWQPKILHPERDSQKIAEIRALPGVIVSDTITEQISELIETLYPKEKISEKDLAQRAQVLLQGRSKEFFGVWVFYPWLNSLVHVLPQDTFTFLRTTRNCYKITPDEQNFLSQKKVGIVGLSVGSSVALALAMERGFGELRLADFDNLNLSNLNRIPQKISNLGLPKAVICARMLFEIDPFLNIKVFPDGLKQENSESFFTEGGPLDIVVDECDSLDIKVHIRHMAQKYKIPVVMETSDRGLLDIERFDQNPKQKIFHGLVGDPSPEILAGLTTEQKTSFVSKLVGLETASARAKASLFEINQTLKTWPQLASAVLHGGGVVADTVRRILLGENISSGRYYVDFNQLIPATAVAAPRPAVPNPPDPRENLRAVVKLTKKISLKRDKNTSPLSSKQLLELVKAGQLAPSAANVQPWLFTSKRGRLFLWQRENRGRNVLDEQLTRIGHGTCLENISLKARTMGYQTIFDFPKRPKNLICQMTFQKSDSSKNDPLSAKLAAAIGSRKTERNFPQKKTALPADFRLALDAILAKAPGQQLYLLDNPGQIEQMAQLIAQADRIRTFGENRTLELMQELRFTPQEVDETCEGIDLRSFQLPPAGQVGMQICRDWKSIKCLKDMNLGSGLLKFSGQLVSSSSAVGVLTIKENDFRSWIEGGRLVERIWLLSNSFDLAFHPMTALIFLLNAVEENSAGSFDNWQIQELKKLKPAFQKTVGFKTGETRTFLFRLAPASPQTRFFKRHPLKSVFSLTH